MAKKGSLESKRLFPCPVCKEALEVRRTKKGKPYVVCNSCGIQLFVRVQAGIDAFNRLVERAETEDIWEELAKLDRRYRRQCPKCGRKFWVEKKLIKTSDLDGSVRGFRCPEESCGAIIEWEDET